MPDIPVDFEAPDLAARVERLSPSQIDQLPFGAILLDGEGIVLFYSAAERRLSGYPGVAVGKNFFEIARCFGKVDLRAQIMRAQEVGAVDLEFALAGDYDDATREVRARVQSAHQGGVWLFLQRD